jgi:hypothetical protein
LSLPTSYRKEEKPPYFDGKKLIWDKWLVIFERCKKINNWNDELAAHKLLMYLNADAQDLILECDKYAQNDYKAMISTLSEHYGAKTRASENLVAFKNASQKSKESIRAYALRLRKLVNLAFPDKSVEFKNELLLQTFPDTIRDTGPYARIPYDIVAARPKTFDEMVDIAVRFDDAITGRNTSNKQISNVDVAVAAI